MLFEHCFGVVALYNTVFTCRCDGEGYIVYYKAFGAAAGILMLPG